MFNWNSVGFSFSVFTRSLFFNTIKQSILIVALLLSLIFLVI